VRLLPVLLFFGCISFATKEDFSRLSVNHQINKPGFEICDSARGYFIRKFLRRGNVIFLSESRESLIGRGQIYSYGSDMIVYTFGFSCMDGGYAFFIDHAYDRFSDGTSLRHLKMTSFDVLKSYFWQVDEQVLKAVH
jgi:hypothetical protein